jgi:asparagine N-glycosylation enzyme membrane subunit Stt3
MTVLIVFLLVLIAAATLLVWEARTGRLDPGSHLGASVRATLFFAAVVVGGALLVRSSGSSLLLALALLPVTGFSVYRFWMLIRPILGRSVRQAVATFCVVAVATIFGLGASLSLLPERLDQRVIIEQIFYGDSPGDQRSIDPAARRTARV